MHSDGLASAGSDAIVASAKANSVPVVSGRQLLAWLDGRNSSSFKSISWSGGVLSFSVSIGAGANGLQVMLPVRSASDTLSGITLGGSPVAFTRQMIKGVEYAVFNAQAGTFAASYVTDTTAPVISNVTATSNTDGSVTITWTTDEASTSSVDYGTVSGALNLNAINAAMVTSHALSLSGLTAGTTYYFTVSSKDASNNSATSAEASFAIPQQAGPFNIYGNTPGGSQTMDAGDYELGVKFRSSVAGWITGVRFYKPAGSTGTHTGRLWDTAGTLLASATFVETASGWQEVSFASPVSIAANTTYIASYSWPAGYYPYQANAFVTGVTNGPLTALQNGVDGPNGVYNDIPGAFPQSGNGASYFADVVFDTNPPVDTTPPVISAVNAAPGVDGTSATITWTTDENSDSSVRYGTVSGGLNLSSSTGALVSSHSITLSGLTAGTTYYFTVSSKDASNNSATSAEASFAIPQQAGPFNIYGNTPGGSQTMDTGDYELGVKFRSSVAGWITGVRFYKPAGSTGTHTGRLWNSAGTLLASATFAETAIGWQEVSFASPVSIAANTTYIASYSWPGGYYPYQANAFTTGVTNGPLTALQNGVDGPNGVYNDAPGAFPQSGNGASYFADVIFDTNAPVDTTPPVISAVNAAPGADGTSATITWTTDEASDSSVRYGTVSGVLNLSSSTGALVTSHSITLSGLTAGTTYYFTVSSKDASNNSATSAEYSFATTVRSCPCSIWENTGTPASVPVNDGHPIEVGTKFRSTSAGYITAIRYYKGAGDTDSHVGHLWTSTGTQLAAVTFSGGTASGWQMMPLSTPVAIDANTTYIVSMYSSPVGYFAITTGGLASAVDNPPLKALASGEDGPNGVFQSGGGFPTTGTNNNYWVDVVFDTNAPVDTTPPVISAVNAAPGADGTSATITWTTDENSDSSVRYGTVSGGLNLSSSTGALVTSHSITLSGLTAGTTYYFTVSSKDASNNSASSAEASFATPACYPLTLTHTGTGSNPVASPASSISCPAGQYMPGKSISLSGAVPGAGYEIGSWSGTNNDGSTAATNILTMPNAAQAVAVNYIQSKYSLTVNVAGSGSVTKNPDQATYTYDQSVTLTAVPAVGYLFSGWSGDASGATNPLSLTMNGNKTVTATFVVDNTPIFKDSFGSTGSCRTGAWVPGVSGTGISFRDSCL